MDAAKTLKNHIKYLKNNSEKKTLSVAETFGHREFMGFGYKRGIKAITRDAGLI